MTRLLALLVLVVMAVNAASAQGSYRLKRPGEQPAGTQFDQGPGQGGYQNEPGPSGYGSSTPYGNSGPSGYGNSGPGGDGRGVGPGGDGSGMDGSVGSSIQGFQTPTIDTSTPKKGKMKVKQGETVAPFEIGVQTNVVDIGAQSGNLQGQTGMLQGGANSGALKGGLKDSGLEAGTGLFDAFKLNGTANNTALQGGLTQAQIQRLSEHDVVLLIDRSTSMSIADCPPPGAPIVNWNFQAPQNGMTRWNWCRLQTMQLAQTTSGIYRNGFTVVLYDRDYKIFQHVRINQVPMLFRQNAPSPVAGTNVEQAVDVILRDYFTRKNSGQPVKPLALSLITDGSPRRIDNLRSIIARATRSLQSPDEISISMFVIANWGPRARATIESLADIRGAGGKYDIVQVVPFTNVQNYGLSRALAESLDPRDRN